MAKKLLTLFFLLFCSSAQAKSLDHWQFETSLEGWISPEGINGVSAGTCNLSHRDFSEGKASLACLYKVTPGHIFAMGRELNLGKQQVVFFEFQMKSLRTPQWYLSLEEKDGSSYVLPIELSALNQWQGLSISSQMFKLGQDSYDENKKLDLHQVDKILLFDISGLLAFEQSKTAVLIDDFKIKTPG